MIDHLLKFFVTFLVVVEPIGVIPIFIAMTEGVSEPERRRMARNVRGVEKNEDEEFDALAGFALERGAYPWDVI